VYEFEDTDLKPMHNIQGVELREGLQVNLVKVTDGSLLSLWRDRDFLAPLISKWLDQMMRSIISISRSRAFSFLNLDSQQIGYIT
jgi:hypothetical protein